MEFDPLTPIDEKPSFVHSFSSLEGTLNRIECASENGTGKVIPYEKIHRLRSFSDGKIRTDPHCMDVNGERVYGVCEVIVYLGFVHWLVFEYNVI